MLKVDVGEGYHQLAPEDYVGWELGDEYLYHAGNEWCTTSFSTEDRHQVGLVAVFRRPDRLGLWRGFKIALRKAHEGLTRRFSKKKV